MKEQLKTLKKGLETAEVMLEGLLFITEELKKSELKEDIIIPLLNDIYKGLLDLKQKFILIEKISLTKEMNIIIEELEDLIVLKKKRAKTGQIKESIFFTIMPNYQKFLSKLEQINKDYNIN